MTDCRVVNSYGIAPHVTWSRPAGPGYNSLAVKNHLNNDKPTFQQAAWKDAILNSSSNVTFVHKAGAENLVADFLSKNTGDNEEGMDLKVEEDFHGIRELLFGKVDNQILPLTY